MILYDNTWNNIQGHHHACGKMVVLYLYYCRKSAFSGTEMRKCNKRKCAFVRAQKSQVSLRPTSGF